MKHHFTQKIDILDDDRPIQTHLFLKEGDVIHFGFRRQQQERGVRVQKEQEKGNHRNDKAHPNRFDEPFDDICPHSERP